MCANKLRSQLFTLISRGPRSALHSKEVTAMVLLGMKVILLSGKVQFFSFSMFSEVGAL